MKIIICIQVCCIREWTSVIRKMVERKALLASLKHQYHVSQCGERGCSANNNRNGDYNEYLDFVLFNEWALIIRKMVEINAFLPNQSISMVYLKMENITVVPRTKTIEIFMSIQVRLISWMTINYKENSGKKSFSCKSKASILCIPIWRTWL